MRRGLIASFTAAGILVTSLLLTPAWAVPNYPSAAEVATAKRSVTEKKKMITRIEGILNTLESEARELEAIALEKSEQYSSECNFILDKVQQDDWSILHKPKFNNFFYKPR